MYASHIPAMPLHIMHLGTLWSKLGLTYLPNSLTNVWSLWRAHFRGLMKDTWDALAKAILWNVWLEKNMRVFNSYFLSSHTLIFKITYMFIFWVYTTLECKRQRLDECVQIVKRNLEFIDPGRIEPSSLGEMHISTRPVWLSIC